MQIIRTTNPNGTYRYEIDGELQYAASKVLYTHVSVFTNDAVTFHKTENAANKSRGYKYWTKREVVAIIDGDAAVETPADETPAPVAPTGPAPKIYTATNVGRDGGALRGAAEATYATSSAQAAAQMHAARTLHTPRLAGSRYTSAAEFFTFADDGSDHAPLRVRVEHDRPDVTDALTYEAVVVSPTTGKPLRGAPTRKYYATSAVEAGRLYAAGQGLPNPLPAARYGGDATREFFTYRPDAAQGATMRVRVRQVEHTNEAIGGVAIHGDAAIFGMCLRYANRNGIDYWALTVDEKFALEDAARNAETN